MNLEKAISAKGWHNALVRTKPCGGETALLLLYSEEREEQSVDSSEISWVALDSHRRSALAKAWAVSS